MVTSAWDHSLQLYQRQYEREKGAQFLLLAILHVRFKPEITWSRKHTFTDAVLNTFALINANSIPYVIIIMLFYSLAVCIPKLSQHFFPVVSPNFP